MEAVRRRFSRVADTMGACRPLRAVTSCIAFAVKCSGGGARACRQSKVHTYDGLRCAKLEDADLRCTSPTHREI
jgi:hypothetical protein